MTTYIEKKRLWIYGVALAISIILIALFFIPFPKDSCPEKWCTLSMSVGASGIGAVVLAFFIDFANGKRDFQKKAEQRKVLLEDVIFQTNHLIERSFYWFNRIKHIVREEDDSEICYKAKSDIFLDHLDSFAGEIESPSYQTKNASLIHEACVALCSIANSTAVLFERMLHFYAFEKNDLFSHEELTTFQGVINVLKDCDKNSTEVFSMLCVAFDSRLRSIDNFQYLNNTILFYKNKKTVTFFETKDAMVEKSAMDNATDLF